MSAVDPRTATKRTETYAMKNRNWFCYSLDILGLGLLGSAVIALLASAWLGGTALEITLLGVFRIALMGAVGAFLTARSAEILRLVREEKAAPVETVEPYHADNVESLPERRKLPRAA